MKSERLDKIQTSMVSPSKPRMKFTVVPHHQLMKQDGSNSKLLQRHSRSSRATTMPSKWNDAEKWILNKENQNLQVITTSNTQNRLEGAAPQPLKKRADFTNPRNALIEASVPTMRDVGTEMTPIPSQEPSRSPTPEGAATPLPSSPQNEQEMKSKIAREIVALGMHLGKMNIVAWASKDDPERNTEDRNRAVDSDEARKMEYRKRADAWEEADKSKHEARFKREEIRIQARESRKKAKSIAITRRMEAKIEQIRAQIQAKMASEKRKAEEQRTAIEARKDQQHQKTAAQAEYIQRTGRIPTNYFTICWSKKQFYD